MKSRRYRTGFSLIEAAIVLGIVGLVIGGIWIAASTISLNNKVSASISGLLETSYNLRSIYKGIDRPASGTDITTVIRDGGIISGKFMQGSTVTSPFGGAVTAKIGISGLAANTDTFSIRIYNVSVRACWSLIKAAVVSATAGGQASKNIKHMNIYDVALTQTSGFSIADASDPQLNAKYLCPTTDRTGNWMEFGFDF